MTTFHSSDVGSPRTLTCLERVMLMSGIISQPNAVVCSGTTCGWSSGRFVTGHCPTVAAGCSWLRNAVRAGDSTLAFARRKSSGMRHRFSPLFISPYSLSSLTSAKCHLRKSGRSPAFSNVPSGPNRVPQPLASKSTVNFSCLSYGLGQKQSTLLRNVVRAKIRKGGAEIFCRSGRAGDDIVDRKRFVRKQKPEVLLTMRSPARGTGKKIGASSPSESKRRPVADTVRQCQADDQSNWW